MRVRTRFAPSPTGDLHLGGAWTALASWAVARAASGVTVLRVEDIDTPRVVPGAAERILEDLAWLGLVSDEGPVYQSSRVDTYAAALTSLAAREMTYPCDCSRAEIARAASAPHAGEESVYPGTCRQKDPARAMKRPPATRVRVPPGEVTLVDAIAGTLTQDLARDVGDFVLWRGDGLVAYQLAVVVDDLAMGITDVLRGDDLLASTPRQVFLMRALGATDAALPRYAHLPLVVAADGARLAKRTAGATVRDLRARGVSAEEILGELAHGLGLTEDARPRPAGEIAEAAREGVAWRRAPWRIPERWAGEDRRATAREGKER